MTELDQSRKRQGKSSNGPSRPRRMPVSLWLPLVVLVGLASVGLLLAVIPFSLGQVLARIQHDPSPCLIKGDISISGERLYYFPDRPHYDQTMIATRQGERWFCSGDEARAGGWRPAARQ